MADSRPRKSETSQYLEEGETETGTSEGKDEPAKRAAKREYESNWSRGDAQRISSLQAESPSVCARMRRSACEEKESKVSNRGRKQGKRTG